MLVIPVYNMILLPDSTVYFETAELKRSAGAKGIALNEKVILIMAKEKLERGQMKEDSFYPIGVAGTVSEIMSGGYTSIHLEYRVDLLDVFIDREQNIRLSVSRRNSIQDLDPSLAREKRNAMIAEMRRFAEGFEWGKNADLYLNRINSLEPMVIPTYEEVEEDPYLGRLIGGAYEISDNKNYD